MTVYITAITPASATHHQHIAGVRWLDSNNSTSKTMTVAQAVAWIQNGHQLWVAGTDGPVAVHVVNGNPPHIRTVANNTYTDNLLELPTY